ncbi:MAG: GNAT family N-acetyltransferase [Gammaproteobacteria bacterium]|nr:GNAT family N-acetyltransferase [Gammaproteobacteria bacterium]
MLVKLYELPDATPYIEAAEKSGVMVRRAMPYEKKETVNFVQSVFGSDWGGWSSECDVAFSNSPPSCFIATHASKIVGFACYNSTCKGYFGPTGVMPEFEKKGLGSALLLASLRALSMDGYGYGIIGGAGSYVQGFYKRVANAEIIQGSDVGIYRDMLGKMRF